MAMRMILGGFDELQKELAALPETARAGSAAIEQRYAQATQAEVKAAYPIITGNLRAGVKVTEKQPEGKLAVDLELASSAPHAHLYEYGSAHQPPRATFQPIAERGQREATGAVISYVEGLGLKVRGGDD